MPGHGGLDALDARGIGRDGVIKGQWPVEHTSGDLATIGHLAQCRSIQGRKHARVDGLDRREDRHLGLGNADGVRQVDGVAHDVGLDFERRSDIDGGVGDDEGPRVAGRLHDVTVRQSTLGAQAGFGRQDGTQVLIAVQAAFHQRLHLALASQPGGGGRCGVAVRHIDDLAVSQFQPRVGCNGTQLGERCHQYWCDDAGIARVQGTAQAERVTRVHHRGANRGHGFDMGDKTLDTALRVGASTLRGLFMHVISLPCLRQLDAGVTYWCCCWP